ncbi:hypothetical protein R1sor_006918 [Riccia sorocarpa]|uniref:NFX1-type zinc finger-containing protein 1 n=1 Tax=Riccia sorocarpa TaxID=122646 RepID=A0ABD3HSG0_9MARC
MDQPTETVKTKMKFLDIAKVVTLTSKEEPHLSSMENLKKLVYRTFPELEKLCENTSSWRNLTLEMKYEDGDGDLITLESDGDLKSFIQWQKSNQLIFHLDTKKGISEGPTSLERSYRNVRCWSEGVPSLLGMPGRSSDASSSKSNSLKRETRAKQQQCRYYARGHCTNGANCGFSHEQDRNGELPLLPRPSPWNLSNRGATGPPREITNFGVWVRDQLERDAMDNITFLSGDKGFDVLAKMVERKNLPSQSIDLLVRLLTRDEFRLSLMREHTNKIYGLLIGSAFLLQLHGHIMTQLGTAKPQEIMPCVLLMDALQTRTANGWKEVPLDGINIVIQQVEETAAKKELVVMVNRLIEHRNKLHRQAVLSSTDDETQFLGAKYRKLSIVPSKSELLQPHMSLDLPVNLVGKRYASLLSYLETHFRLLREDCIDPLRQGICAFRNQQSSRELRVYQHVRPAGYRCGEHGVEYKLSFRDNGTNLESSNRLIFGALVCLSYDEFQDSFIFGVVTNKTAQGIGTKRYLVCIRLVASSEGQEEEPLAEHRTYVMVESTTAYFEAYYHVLKSLQREDMEDIPFTKYLLDLEQQVDPPFYLQRREKGDEFDFESVFPTMTADGGRSIINILQDWPQFPSSLDQAQLQALKHGLTKELAIIQGPPGTGKTFLGLLLVRLLLVNFKPAEHSTDIFGRKMQPVLSINEKKYGRKGPILVICMTNHALDQFLEGIFKFESSIIRIGGRSKSTVLQERNLKHLLEVERQARDRTASASARHRFAKGKAWSQKVMLAEEIQVCTKILNATHVRMSELYNVATHEQIRNLFSDGMDTREEVKRWLAGDVLPLQNFYRLQDKHIGNLFAQSLLDSDEELVDLQFEKKERTGKKVVLLNGPAAHHQPGNRNHDSVNGGDEDEERRGIFDLFQAMDLGEFSVEDLLDDREDTDEEQEVNSLQSDEEVQNQDQNGNQNEEEDEAPNEQLQLQYFVDFPDVWRLNQEQRRILHEHWLADIKMKYRNRLQILQDQYEKACKVVNEIDEEIKLSLLRRANVVGMTTTSAARCQKTLQALNSEIVIVEEAAEVLEAHVLASLNSCVKHLVLIGDHQQLRPSTAVYRLAMKHKLDVSMFERLLEGGVEHVTLQEQRRMRPSFARLVKSLYPNLKDHESVTKYENVKGMNCNLLFFDHTAKENSISVDTSKVNTSEAKLVVELTLYLLKQDCYSAENIAILTMYTGQITEIRKILKDRASATLSPKYLERMRKMQEKQARLQDDDDSEEEGVDIRVERVDDIMKLLPRVTSVDNFQGEEADIIILSLVRSNDIETNEGEGTIGFLKTSNRICVALTRAKKGMYIFGNATLLAKRSDMWKKVIHTLQKDNALDTKLEFCCQNHPDTKTIVRKEEDVRQVEDGGCSRPCEAQLDCGHVCPRRCHPGSHDEVICPKPCMRREPCSWRCEHHQCELLCHEICTRPRCDAPCKQVLSCGHPCIGLCGEPCPSKCKICDGETLEIITQMTLADFEEADRFHQLQDCKHVFEISGLDRWMDGDDIQGDEGRKSTAVKMKECPQCKVPVWRSARYANVVKGKLAKLEAVKLKINGYEKIRQGQQELESGGDPARAFLLFMGALKQNPALMEARFGAGQALCKSKRYARGAVFFSFIVKKSSYASNVESVLKSTSDIDKVVEKSKVDCPAPKDEVAVKAMLQLASAFTALGEFTSAEKLCEAVLKNHPENKDAEKIKADAGNRLTAKVIQQELNDELGVTKHELN